MRVTVLSRASDLARLQADLVVRAWQARWPESDDELVCVTRASAGDLDATTPLAAMADKGAFTQDLTDALRAGTADLVVHSWKDLPVETRPGTVVAATLERADPRDVLLVREETVAARPDTLTVFTSSPRRAWLLERGLRPLLPWPVSSIRAIPVRGNVPTRLAKLAAGGADALVVAKAALDRLLTDGGEDVARALRRLLAGCRWMVLPLREFPGAPAQGALAIEARSDDARVLERLRGINHSPTWTAVTREREYLRALGGGCHDAIAATAVPRPFGTVFSAKAAVSDEHIWTLERAAAALPPPAAPDAIWPRPDERGRARRRTIDAAPPIDDHAWLVARAHALPPTWSTDGRVIWTAGVETWKALAARGVWVHGSSDGLGADRPPIDALAGRPLAWTRLTNRAAAVVDPASSMATYDVDDELPDDLAERSHFFWMSPAHVREAFQRWPEIASRWHASGPGRTAAALAARVNEAAPAGAALAADRVSVWLDYDQWRREIVR